VVHTLIVWIEGTSLNQLVQNVFWIIPVVQTIHILSVSVVISSMAMLDLRLMGLAGTRHPISAVARRFMPWMWCALPVLLITGTVLIIGEPGRSLGNWVFQLKMSLLVLAVALSLAFTRKLKRDLEFREPLSALRNTSRILGLLSLMLWIGIVICGRWIAYVGGET
jgi:putative copper export protein